jgi:hypothetical protein
MRKQTLPVFIAWVYGALPDIHIYTASKQPWVILPRGMPAGAEYCRASEVWPKESLERRAVLLAQSSQDEIECDQRDPTNPCC